VSVPPASSFAWELPLGLAAAGALTAAGALAACKQTPATLPPITAPWHDDFERADLGPDYNATDPDAYQISGGQLHVHGAYNHPLWLRHAIPRDCAIEFDVKSNSPDGDIKVEAWGDGKHHAPSKAKVQYTASGYVFIFGGWANSSSIVAKQSEHGKDVIARQDVKVVIGRTYHMKIVRHDGEFDWFIDDMSDPFLKFLDHSPLDGPANSYFAFSNWESDLWFDNLSVTPL